MVKNTINKLKLLKRKIFTKLIALLVQKEQYIILILLTLLNIKEKKNGKNRRFFSTPSGKITILALDSDRYRGDLEVLSSHAGIRVLFMNQKAPGWLVKSFYSGLDIPNYINAEKNSADAINHKKAYEFMKKFLHKFYQYVSVDCVTTVNYVYLEDYNWTKASDVLGVPFIMLYRECLLASDSLYDRIKARRVHKFGLHFGKFHGSHIIVHNDICKQMFIDIKYTSADKITVAGALRMDGFLKLIKQSKNKKKYTNNKKTFIFFYFPYNSILFGHKEKKSLGIANIWTNRDKLFSDLHSAVIELAVEYPNVDFIIKPKKRMVRSRSWGFYQDVVNKSKVNVKKLSNYRVDAYLNVSEGIANANIICALQSSVVVESAIANKRVIFPLFYNYLSSPHSIEFFWKNDLELFDVATNKSDFKRLFKDALDNPNISKDIQHKRTELFEKWFGSIRGDSLNKYYNIIKENIQ